VLVVQRLLWIGFTLAELAEVLKAREAGGAVGRPQTSAPLQGTVADVHLADEARGAEQFGQVGEERLGFGRHAQLTGSNWIMKKSGDFVEAFYFCWRPRRDLNPCYRRERAQANRITL
jgi:hypothetical protein